MQKIGELNGKYASAVVFTDNIEDYAKAQIKMICDNEATLDEPIKNIKLIPCTFNWLICVNKFKSKINIVPPP